MKGEDRPFDQLPERMDQVLKYAQAVIPFEGDENPLLMAIRPDVVFKGYDHSPKQTHYAARVPGWKNGPHGIWKAQVIHIGQLSGFSTTLLAHARPADA